MKNKYLLTLILLIASITIDAQEIRINNSFIILVNDELVRTVAGLKLITTDMNGKEDSIEGGYYAGVLYVSNTQSKDLIYADSIEKLILKFDYYQYQRDKQIIHNYTIGLDKKWFKESFIVVKITDANKKNGSYSYTFEVPGISFGKRID